MRRTTAAVQSQSLPLPRGWIVLGAALASWALFAGAWSAVSQLFMYVSNGI